MKMLTLAATLVVLGSGCLLATDELGEWAGLADAGAAASDAGGADGGGDPSAEIFTCDAAPACDDAVWCWQDARAGKGDLNAIWASGSVAWIAGAHGVLIRYDGTHFTRVDSVTTAELRTLTGSSSDDVWVGGSGGTLLHWNGTKWQSDEGPAGVEVLTLFSESADTLWAGGTRGKRGVVLRRTGGTWTQELEHDAPITAIGASADKVLVGAEDGETFSFDGKQFSSDGRRSVGIRAIWSPRPNLAFAAGGGITTVGELQSLIARWTGRHWSEDLHGVGEFLSGLHGTTAAEAWAVGTSGTALRYDGTRWSTVKTGISADLRDVWSFGEEHAIAVGTGGAIGRFARVACNP